MVPSCRGGLQKCPNHTVKNQIQPHRTETSPEDYDLDMPPDHGFHGLLGNPLRGFKGQACLLVYSIVLAEGFQTNSPLWSGGPTPYRSHGCHVSPPPRGRETRLPVSGFIPGEVTRRDSRDHLVSRELKNPSEMVLYANYLWDTRKAISTDHLLAAVSTSLSSPSRGRTQARRSPSPNRRSQTPGPSKSECWFPQSFGPAANNCPPPCSFQGNARADVRRKNKTAFPSVVIS